MLRWGVGFIATLLALSTYDGAQESGGEGFDTKLSTMVTEQEFWHVEMAQKPQGGTITRETSELITFSESFSDIEYGDVLGRIEMEVIGMDCDIVYARDRNDAILRSGKTPDCVYFYFSEGGSGLNASYINLYADESIMQDYDDMEEIADLSDDNYLHLWIEAGGERLQMDILVVYYSDDMQSDDGILRAMIETDFIPEEAAQSDIAMLEYMQECMNYMPGDYNYDKMITIDNLRPAGLDQKRIIVAVNVPAQ